MTESTHKPEIVLASSSPRRRDLLSLIGIAFRVFEPQVEEKPRGSETAREYALRNAVEKARQVARHMPSGGKELSARYIVVAADTIVTIHERILEKPRDREHARAMLQSLSGQRHEVITGLCVLGLGWPKGPREKSLLVRTEVDMKSLTDDEIESYIDSGEPMDKAGSYAVQGRGCYMIRAVNGSYTNVVGLPLSELVDILEQDFGYLMR
ncbi:MAG TPA: septum formation inhibitor Maf [Verrucomicrobia bacterium]|nr:MAG: septum formation protein Maf [Lentisphaerae bacterium GWF2_57_35]HBA82541.1 septum formation inhibitor Maf [Verrucomicrobiota bacterium]